MATPLIVRVSSKCLWLLGLVFVCASVAPASAQPQTPAQAGCISALNRNLDKVAKTQRKEALRCLKFASRGRLPEGLTLDQCVDVDLKGKVNKALARMAGDDIKRCEIGDPPRSDTPAPTPQVLWPQLKSALCFETFTASIPTRR